MAGPWQCTAFFNSLDSKNGFSEVYYNVRPAIADAKIDFDLLLDKRLAMMPNQVQLVYARISDVNEPGDAYLLDREYPVSGSIMDIGGSEPLSVGVLVRFETADGYRSMRILRALPEGSVDREKWVSTPGFQTAWEDYRDDLVDTLKGWALRKVGPAPGVYVYDAMKEGYFLSRITHRNAGRPFGLLRGRRSD